jgi:hypothetical protein
LIDSTGIKFLGDGEWQARKHGVQGRRQSLPGNGLPSNRERGRKVHLAMNTATSDTFTTYGGPANLLEAANTMGLPLYARQHLDEKGRWIDLMTEASILPVNKRPRIAIRIHTSN